VTTIMPKTNAPTSFAVTLIGKPFKYVQELNRLL
jgi:hypothetical protein